MSCVGVMMGLPLDGLKMFNGAIISSLEPRVTANVSMGGGLARSVLPRVSTDRFCMTIASASELADIT